MKLSKKSLETLGGIGSILTGLVCSGIGMMDFSNNQRVWKVWLMMTIVLVLNGFAMIRHASQRTDDDRSLNSTSEVVKLRI